MVEGDRESTFPAGVYAIQSWLVTMSSSSNDEKSADKPSEARPLPLPFPHLELARHHAADLAAQKSQPSDSSSLPFTTHPRKRQEAGFGPD